MLLATIHNNGQIIRNPNASEEFVRDHAREFVRRMLERESVKPLARPEAVRQGGTCAICDAVVEVAETEELPVTCGRAVCVARLTEIAQRLGDKPKPASRKKS